MKSVNSANSYLGLKHRWHVVDAMPNAQKSYTKARQAIKAIQSLLDTTPGASQACPRLDALERSPYLHNKTHEEIEEARAIVTMFFLDSLGLQQNEPGQDPELLQQRERSLSDYAEVRCHISNVHWDASPQTVQASYEWDKRIRPIIASHFKENIIRPVHGPSPRGDTVLKREPGHLLDVYWRYKIGSPVRFKGPDMLAVAREYATTRPNARFALLRLWSASYFYPLPLENVNERPDTTFADVCDRRFEWTVLPKVEPYFLYTWPNCLSFV